MPLDVIEEVASNRSEDQVEQTSSISQPQGVKKCKHKKDKDEQMCLSLVSPPPPPPSSPMRWHRHHRHRKGKKEHKYRVANEHRQNAFERASSTPLLLDQAGERGDTHVKLMRKALHHKAAIDSTAAKLYGFKPGDRVTTRGGPDEEGPWRSMGRGVIVGAGSKPGYLDVKFDPEDGNRDNFSIRAKNLTKVSEPSSPIADSPTVVCGIRSGDAVIWQSQGSQSRGVVAEVGRSPDFAMVKFSGLGTRSVRVDQLRKVVFSYQLEQVGETLSKEKQQRMKDLRAAAWARIDPPEDVTAKAEGAPHRLKVGCCVNAKVSPWKNMGIGIVKKLDEEEDTAEVQFNIMGESWTLKCADLTIVEEDPGMCKFNYHLRHDFERKQVRAL
jgi:hypothetical protein